MPDLLPVDLQAKAVTPAPPPPLAEAYWVVPGRLMAGPHPGGFRPSLAGERVERLLEAGISYFLNLTEAGEALAYEHQLRCRARHRRMDIVDFDVPSHRFMTSVLDEIDRALAAGHNIYLHCYAGLGRTGTVVGCYLVRHGLAGDEALRAIRELRRETAFPDSPSPQTEEQARMVRRWRA
jgi:hypothetical protein